MMAQHNIETMWMGGMQFNALLDNHTIIMDAPKKSGGEELGTIPKPLVLAALSGCTGMDIIVLLRKAAIRLQDLSIKVTGELSKQPPIEYIAVHIVYQFKADPSCRQQVLQAVNDSQEKYCGVSKMLKRALPVTWRIVFNNEEIFNNSISKVTV